MDSSADLEEESLEDQYMEIEEDKTHLFLNDETINHYMNLITERSPNSVYAFNTFFYPTYMAKGYSHISRWTKKVDIFDKKKLFIPIYIEENMHWCLVYVDFIEKSIKYYDSLGGKDFFCLKQILKYLMHEHMDKKGEQFDAVDYWLINMTDCHLQENYWDCGVFVCMFAEHLSRDEPLQFTQADMERFRKQINYEIKHKKLIKCTNKT